MSFLRKQESSLGIKLTIDMLYKQKMIFNLKIPAFAEMTQCNICHGCTYVRHSLKNKGVFLMKKILVICVFLCLTIASLVYAGQFYDGVDVGYITQNFKPHYFTLADSSNQQYYDSAFGTEINLFGGYKIPVKDDFDVKLQGSFSINNAIWSLFFDMPNDTLFIKYSIPYNYEISILPTLSIIDNLSLFGELGIGQGYVIQQEYSPNYSEYDFSKMVNNCILGIGFSYKLNNSFRVNVKYRHICYDDYTFTTHLANGSPIEIFKDQPESTSISGGIEYLF